MVVLDLKTGKPSENPSKIELPKEKIPNTQKLTGVKFSWIYDAKELITTTLGKPEFEAENEIDRGQYFQRPEGAIGVLVQSGNEPATINGWHTVNSHEGYYNLYGDQPDFTQQTYYLGGTNTIFIGLF
ncbi:uncharacterized protein KGF55_001742 [Candida pseudojiufengensis]|uniref:uncharacterized protein n=1 Tax=Candida pseudojiufengensis TaxID=497109 RepID=UPI0022248311|nr:uncharacterized protein KGF55_001742 [Candida pseudojiufengensis]KAI5964673.1 hypothetical protein KGF55_001742 [Candida pseudojiufengensis]